MWDKLLDRFLIGLMVRDRLSITYPDGHTADYGPDTGDRAHIAIKGTKTLRALVLNPDLGLGEGYMDGRITTQNCTLDHTMKILIRNRSAGSVPAWMQAANSARNVIRRAIRKNAPQVSRKNVAHHYDISDDLYSSFLDADMQYSCAYFRKDSMTLEEAQIAKKAHIAAKLHLEPGMRVLDIGSGWGGMALTLARDYGCDVTGITLSENQLAKARARAEAMGLSDRVTFKLEDYRHSTGVFDRIVSVGMMEHVGARNWTAYFSKVHDLLADDGVALIHTIGHRGQDFAHSSWIDKYIFPGFEIPNLTEIAHAADAADFWIGDVEPLRVHYADTLKAWRERYSGTQSGFQHADGRFIRMWQYYLSSMENSFRYGNILIYQIQLAKHIDTLPLTRDYLHSDEQDQVIGAAIAR
jgi:cyclopropane-fatty-acyl-phospholipid synthase